MAKVIQPPDYSHVSLDGYLVFLAGPIQGSNDWQSEVIAALETEDVTIANPRVEPWHGDYDVQVEWELHYLRLASMYGKIFFWLQGQNPTLDHDPDRSYAQTSRFELGEWVGRSMELYERKFVIGIEPGFSGERYIRKRLGLWYPDIVIPSTLEETIALFRDDLSGER